MNQLTKFCSSAGVLLLLAGCGPEIEEPPSFAESEYEPILMTREVLEKSIRSTNAGSIDIPGKMYRYGDMLYISERYEGVHVIDNSDPSNPVNKGFVHIPGCVDVAVRGNTLFANSASDLVVVNISNLEDVVVTDRVAKLFPDVLDPDGVSGLSDVESSTRPENTEIINWTKN